MEVDARSVAWASPPSGVAAIGGDPLRPWRALSLPARRRRPTVGAIAGGVEPLMEVLERVLRRRHGCNPACTYGRVLAVSPDERLLLVNGDITEVWSIPDGERLWRSNPQRAGELRFCEDSRLIWGEGVDYAGMTDDVPYEILLDARTGAELWSEDRYSQGHHPRPDFRLADGPGRPVVRVTSHGIEIRDGERTGRIPGGYRSIVSAPRTGLIIGLRSVSFQIWAWAPPR